MPMHHPHPPPTTQRIDNHNFVLIGLAWQWSAAVLRHTVQQCNTKIQSLHRANASSYDCDGIISLVYKTRWWKQVEFGSAASVLRVRVAELILEHHQLKYSFI